MNGGIKIAGTFVRVKVDRQERSSNDAESMAFPVGHNVDLILLIRYQFYVQPQLPVDFTLFV